MEAKRHAVLSWSLERTRRYFFLPPLSHHIWLAPPHLANPDFSGSRCETVGNELAEKNRASETEHCSCLRELPHIRSSRGQAGERERGAFKRALTHNEYVNLQ